MALILGSGQFAGQKADRPHAVNSEVADLREDIVREFAANAAIAIEEFTAPIAAGAALISAAALSTVAPRSPVLLALAATISPPRQISVTTAASGTPADAPATALVTGKDIFGNTITETLTVSQTNATVTGAKCFASVSSILEAAGDGVGATLSYGIGAPIGLGRPIKTRAGVTAPVKEFAAGSAAPTAGVFAAPAAALPNGSYAPNSAADGARNYALYYEYDVASTRKG